MRPSTLSPLLAGAAAVSLLAALTPAPAAAATPAPIRMTAFDQALYQAQADTYYFDRQWGLHATRTPDVWPVSTGAGITVAVVDSGVTPIAGHLPADTTVLPGAVFTSGTGEQKAPAEYYDGRSDSAGHGTFVASVLADSGYQAEQSGMAGVAPGVKILPVDVLDSTGGGWDADVAAGITWAVDHGADIINLSLGGPDRSPAVTAAIGYARSRDVLVVAAAGNAAKPCSSYYPPPMCDNPVMYPAADDGVYAVGATVKAGYRASWSSYGPWIDIAGPGDEIYGRGATGRATLESGSSFAAPHVAGAAALVWAAHPQWTDEQVLAALDAGAVDLGDPGRDDKTGAGLVNPAQALGIPVPTPAPPPAPTLTLSASTTTAPYGSTVTLTALVQLDGAPVAAANVSAVAFPVTGGAQSLTPKTTATDGTATWQVPARVTRVYKATYSSGGNTASGEVRVLVAQKVKATPARSGTATVFAVAVYPAGASKLRLQRQVGGVWKTVATGTADARGRAKLADRRPPRVGTYRVVAAARPDAAAGTTRLTFRR